MVNQGATSSWGRRHGPRLWQELHASYTPGFLWPWLDRVTCAKCRATADAIVAAMQPPPRPSLVEWRVWTWDFHNAVRRHVGQAELTLAEADRLHGWNLPAELLAKANGATQP